MESLKTKLRDELLDREIFHQLRGRTCCPDRTGRLTTASDWIARWATDRRRQRPSCLRRLSRAWRGLKWPVVQALGAGQGCLQASGALGALATHFRRGPATGRPFLNTS